MAMDCVKATTAIEHAVCRDPELRSADIALSRRYLKVRSVSKIEQQATLVRRQREWIAQRDAKCRTSTGACLAAAYTSRLDQLVAATKAATGLERISKETGSPFPRGAWRVGPVTDPGGRPLPPDLARQLASARLPSPGEIVRAQAGKFCAGSVPRPNRMDDDEIGPVRGWPTQHGGLWLCADNPRISGPR